MALSSTDILDNTFEGNGKKSVMLAGKISTDKECKSLCNNQITSDNKQPSFLYENENALDEAVKSGKLDITSHSNVENDESDELMKDLKLLLNEDMAPQIVEVTYYLIW